MKAPPPLWLISLLAVTVDAVSQQSIHTKISEGLPRYDASVRDDAMRREEAPGETHAEASSLSPAAPAPQRLIAANAKAVVLPEVVVTTEKPKPGRPKPLPRVEPRPAPGKAKLEPFLTPEERNARLEEKHLGALDRKVLNRFTLFRYGASTQDRAREAEAIERSAGGLNEVASQIENATAAGADAEYIRNLEKIYYQMYLSRPK